MSVANSNCVKLQKQVAVAGTWEGRPGLVHGGEWQLHVTSWPLGGGSSAFLMQSDHAE